MSSTTETGLTKSLLAPLSGQAIPLDQVPDDVFSQKILGDGIAIIPTDGKIYAPIDGDRKRCGNPARLRLHLR